MRRLYPQVKGAAIHSDSVQNILILILCKTPTGALVWLLGFRIAGFMLSGSAIRVFVLGNMGLGWVDEEKYKSMIGEGRGVVGTGCGGEQGWWCVLLIGGA